MVIVFIFVELAFKVKNNFNSLINGNHSNKIPTLNVQRLALLRAKNRQTQ
jgi:hypothetical protein